MSPTLLLLMCFFAIVSRPSKAKQMIDDGVISKQERSFRDTLNYGVNCNGFSPCRKEQADKKSSSSILKSRETSSPLEESTVNDAGVTSVWVPARLEEGPVFYGPEDELFYNLRRAMTILQALDGGSWEGVEEADRRKFQKDGVDREIGDKIKEASYEIIASRRITFEKLLGIYDPRAGRSDQSEKEAFEGRIGDNSLDTYSNKRKNMTISDTRANNGSQDVTQPSVPRAIISSGSNLFETPNNATSSNSCNSNQSKNNENSSCSNGVYPSSSQRIRRDLPGLPMSNENIPKPLSMPGLILAHGYPAEVHHVTTEDGYILELHRIPGPRMVNASPKKKRRSGRSTGTSSKEFANPILEDEKFQALLESLDSNQVLSVENMEGMKEILDRYYVKPDRGGDLQREKIYIQRKARFKRSDVRRRMARNRQLIKTVDPMLLIQRSRLAGRSRYGNRRYISSPTRQIPVMNPPPPPPPSPSTPPPSTQPFLRGSQPSVEANAKRSISRATLGINSDEGGNHLNNFNSASSQSDDKDREVKEFIKATSCLESNTPCYLKKDFSSNFVSEQVANGNYKVFNDDWKEGNDIEGDNKPGSHTKKKVVFIQHCLQCSSADFVLNDHNEALGFILADAGYDVWLGNFRGNQYSRRHKTLSPNDLQFWKFKVDDLARYDIPAMILYVLEVTKSDDLYYVGHSLGTMTFFMATSTNPFIMSKIRLMIALAPSGYLDHMRGGLKLLLKSIQSYYRLVEALGMGEIGGVLPWRGPMMRRFCKPESPLVGVCSSLLPALSGRNSGLHDEDYLPLMLANFPSGTSFRLMAQIGQIIGSDGIRMFDFGNHAENMQHYESDIPPHYPLQKITCPVAIMWAENDYIVAPEDVLRTARRLPNVVLNYKVPHPTFNHVDFLFADIARGLVYEPMLKLLAQY